jgi:prophage antirepressor-like protein
MHNNEIMKTFTFQTHDINIIDKQGDPWFVAKDVASALGYRVPKDAITTHCKGAAIHRLPTTGGVQSLKIIPESDVYRLVMRSNLPEAEAFQDWICEEVIPSIRRHGAYMTHATLQQAVTDPKFLIDVLSALQEENLRIASERDEAIRTKSWIGSNREATAMSTASVAVRKVKKLETQLRQATNHATIVAVESKTKAKYRYAELRRYCTGKELDIINVPDKRYGSVKSYPAEAWLAVYDIDIVSMFTK